MRFSSFHATRTAFQLLFLSGYGVQSAHMCVYSHFLFALYRQNDTLGRYIPRGIPLISIYCEAQISELQYRKNRNIVTAIKS